MLYYVRLGYVRLGYAGRAFPGIACQSHEYDRTLDFILTCIVSFDT